ncbi:hypothetical protein ACXIHB_01955 [Tenacibaculum sp. IMCC1]|uniref:RES domain-containing protein n=1 Tax=Tenacibaculum sp. Pbs-1 TaxID=3238748 RepID=A0AB33KTV5_9FLAO
MNFEEFKKVVNKDIEADKTELNEFLTEWLKKLPIPTVTVNQNTFIERAVIISKNGEEFNLDRLSYIPEKLKHIAKEGRFNNAKEPMFYAAFTDLEKPETTRYFLATELDHSLKEKQDKEFNITVTKWLSIESFEAIFLLFKNDYCTNTLTSKALEQIRNSNEFKKLKSEEIEFFELITDEIAKPHSANNYSITNIVFEFYKKKGYKAIVYPGVRSKYRGNNIAMLPEITDNNWICCFGAEFKLTQTGDDIKMQAVYKINLKQDKLVYSKFGKSEFGNETRIDK